MKYPRLKVELFRFLDGNVSVTGSDVTDMIDFDVNAGIETTKDVFSFRLNNPLVGGSISNYLGRGEPVNNQFRVNDDFKIYSWYGSQQPTNIDESLVLFGTLQSYGYDVSSSQRRINIRGANRTEELLSTMTPFSALENVGSINQCHTIIKQMIKRLRQFNPTKKLYASLNNVSDTSSDVFRLTGSVGGIQAFQSRAYDIDGNLIAGSENFQFPAISFNETWKPIYLNIEKLSSPEYTEDDVGGTYIFYIETLPVLGQFKADVGSVIDHLVWKSVSLLTTSVLTEGTDFHSYTVGFDKNDVINTLIVDAGTDLKGAGIIGIAYNLESVGKLGPKTKYYSESRRVFSLIHQDEINAGSAAGSTFTESGYPDGFPWLMLFEERDSFGSYNGSELDATDSTDFNNFLRNESRWKAVNEAQKIVDRLGEERLRLDYNLELGSNNFVPGQLNEFIIKTFGWLGSPETDPSKKLRIRDWTHTWNNTGWNTRIVAREDEKVILDQLT